MENFFDYFFKNGPWITWIVVIVILLLVVLPRWIRLFKILGFYKKKKYDLCLEMALLESRRFQPQRSKTAILTYVLACALALNKKDVFEENIQKITCNKPWCYGMKLMWGILFELDQGNVEAAKQKYVFLCSLQNKQSRGFSRSLHDLFAHYDGSKPFTTETIAKKVNSAIHPTLVRIYSEISNSIQSNE